MAKKKAKSKSGKSKKAKDLSALRAVSVKGGVTAASAVGRLNK